MAEKFLLKRVGLENSTSLSVYEKTGGYQTVKKCLKLEPLKIIEEIKTSGLRGLGGAGFPTGMKWGFIPKDITPKYLVCNADEGEPGTFKDRILMENDPHHLIEGIMISSFAVGTTTAYIFIRGEFFDATEAVQAAVDECYKNQYLGKNIFGSDFSLNIYVHNGAGAYICGEETALLEALEGKRGLPRVKPPFPAIKGLFGKPTVINNVETLCSVPLIMENGAKWYKGFGPEKCPGIKLFPISGHVNKPGLYEMPFGTTLRTLIYDCAGGIRNNGKLKGIIPGGSSSAILTPDDLDTPMDFDSLKAKGSMLGTASIIAIDDTVDMVDVAHNVMHFYAEESCGQCTPCREGTMWSYQILDRFVHNEGTIKDLNTLKDIAKNMAGNTLCALADGAAGPLNAFVTKYEQDFLKHIKEDRTKPQPAIMR